jgi:nitrogen fixation protein FixH
MSWGTKIIIAFVCFIGVLFTLVYISMNQNISLVAENYYEEELAYEDQIQRIKNSNALAQQIEFKLDRKAYEASFVYPSEIKGIFQKGTIQFFRASDARLDKEFVMTPRTEGGQKIDMTGFRTGLWSIKMKWESKDKEYYKELSLVL